MEAQADHMAQVLVAVINNRRDWQIACSEHWYRIPVKHAPARMQADYLAFYQTKRLGQERWAIRYYAPVHECRVVKRRELFPDEPWHPRADDDYYRLALGPLLHLEQPVISLHLRRVTFIMTTLDKLLGANEINDLF
jgi:hypothetical protein